MKHISLFFLLFWLIVPIAQAKNADFSLADLQGKEHSLSDYQGKWVVVNYWATWCPPCIEEIPELVFFHEKHAAKNAVVLGINYEDAPEKQVEQFLQDYMVNYPILLAEPDVASPFGRIDGLPTTYIVSPKGKVVHKKVGQVDLEYLEKIINQFKSDSGVAIK